MATTVLPRPKQYDDTFFKPISLWLTTTDHKLLGFWLIPVSIILYYCGFLTGGSLNAGWTGYAPLTEKAFQGHSLGVDFWAMSIIVWAISGIMASTNFLTTIVALRAPGMRFSRLPLFVGAQISSS